MKHLLLWIVAAFVLAAPAVGASPKPTSSNAGGKATVACRNKIINEWEGTGKIKTTYPLACYRLALSFVSGHADLTEYSSLGDDIRLALQTAIERSHGKKVPAKVGKHYGKAPGASTVGFTTPGGSSSGNGGGTSGGGSGSGSATPTGGGKSSGAGKSHGNGKPTGGNGKPTAAPTTQVADTGSSTPLPLLILGGVALALIAAGVVGTGIRYTRRRNG